MTSLLEVLASEIKAGEWFRKRTGTMVYLRMSDSAVKWHGLRDDHIYGTAYNGNMTAILKMRRVIRSSHRDYLKQIGQDHFVSGKWQDSNFF